MAQFSRGPAATSKQPAIAAVTKIAAVAAVFCLHAAVSFAGTTGKLSGTVVTEKSEPLGLVTVRIEGQRLGALSDEEGHYVILGIPAGTYTIRASRVGYTPFASENVEIRPDFTTTLDIAMPTQAIEMPEVEVKAERPLLQKDATGTTRFISSQDLTALPTRGFREAVSLQTGVFNYRGLPKTAAGAFEEGTQNQASLIVRGGRTNETAQYIDGFSQQNPLTGYSTTGISDNAIQEVVVMTGGFAPEYGRAMSGVVNVITREGTKRYSGSLETVTDNLAGDWIGAPRTDYNIYAGTLGGPVLPKRDDLTFFLSGERRWERDRDPTYMPDAYRQQLEDGASYGVNPDGTPILPGKTYDPDVKPNNSSSAYALQGKLTWRLSDQVTLRAGGLGSTDDWREYVHSSLFNPDFMPRHRDESQTYYGTFSHNVNPRTYYSLGLNYFLTDSRRGDGVHFDDLTASALSYNPAPPAAFNLDYPQFNVPAAGLGEVGQAGAYVQRDASYVGFQGAFTSQISRFNQIRAGADFQRHTLRSIEIFNPSSFGGPAPAYNDVNGYGYQVHVQYADSGQVEHVTVEDLNDGLDGAKHPKIISAYLQDKYEHQGLIINGGARVDYFDVDTPALRNLTRPLGDPSEPGNLPDSLEEQDLETNNKYTRVSPRLGVAFPVDEKTILRFNYGQFYQQPSLINLYVSYDFLQYLIRTHPYVVPVGNPNLRPERTTAYEVGVARLLTDRVRLDLTAYLKNVQDLVQLVVLPGATGPPMYQNRDFGTIKGLDIGFTVRPVRHVGANLAYSISSAQGTGSSSTSQFNIAWLGGNYPKLTAPLDFDQRHKLALDVDWMLGRGEGPKLGSTFRPLENTSVNLLLNVGSGTPYTPTQTYDEVALTVQQPRPSAPLNAHYGPWTSSLDLKITRGIPMGGGQRLDAYVWVLNLLNAKNAIQVYRSSGSATSTNWLTTPDGQTYLANASASGVNGGELYNLAENNPLQFSNPRLVRFGLRVSF